MSICELKKGDFGLWGVFTMSAKTASVILVEFMQYKRNARVQLQFGEYFFLSSFLVLILSIWWKERPYGNMRPDIYCLNMQHKIVQPFKQFPSHLNAVLVMSSHESKSFSLAGGDDHQRVVEKIRKMEPCASNFWSLFGHGIWLRMWCRMGSWFWP